MKLIDNKGGFDSIENFFHLASGRPWLSLVVCRPGNQPLPTPFHPFRRASTGRKCWQIGEGELKLEYQWWKTAEFGVLINLLFSPPLPTLVHRPTDDPTAFRFSPIRSPRFKLVQFKRKVDISLYLWELVDSYDDHPNIAKREWDEMGYGSMERSSRILWIRIIGWTVSVKSHDIYIHRIFVRSFAWSRLNE